MVKVFFSKFVILLRERERERERERGAMAIALPSFIPAPHSSLRPPCSAGFLTEAPSSSSLSQFFPCSATNLSSSRGLDCRMPKQSSLRSIDHAFVPVIEEVCDDQAQLARRTTACLIESSVNSGKNQNICNLDARHGGAVVEFRKEEGNGIINGSGGLNNDCIGKMTVATTQAQVEIDKATSLDGSCAETKEYLSGEKQTIEEGISNASGEDGDEVLSPALLAREISRRRNFAIISHPDAGKTTFTEKLLLYGGAIHQAGAVKARRAARHATSDWMELEKQRGISITSTALVFETSGSHITLLDTPGHQDFGEDTYRTLAAADNAVMLVDAGKGLEPQTRKLFEVCRMRKLPIFTFINKLDRPALEPLDLLDQIEKEFGLLTHPVSWPIGSGDRYISIP
ncbi:hypothetical protein O6H91_03G008500 [Diphasiastrum complanatum]|uniref:Uncharacterized protein n=1 Tax=Diphasiastrum complanatum TaxID=34168 RepID=A0ACC2E3M4_DIPCM|nr:hypothetical protein O6H91_03G008500 [Diphasiastrum complanatum]